MRDTAERSCSRVSGQHELRRNRLSAALSHHKWMPTIKGLLRVRGGMARSTLRPLRLEVASPCTVPWQSMRGDERVRHCSECRLDVFNLSGMSQREAEGLIESRQGRLCVRFYRRPD